MAVVVQKYGGSSVADLDRLSTVASEIALTRAEGHSVVVVVSAMGKTTNQLVELARQAWRRGTPSVPNASPPARELDMLVSTGERVTMALLSIILQARGLDAVSFTGSQSGIITTERHFDARIVEVRPQRIEAELARGRVVIVAGFQGVSREREVTTLGRGGSDTTAVALAAALGASACQICSDVDGVYTADPRQNPAARHLPRVSYAQVLEMASAGARVLHGEAVRHAEKHGVELEARRTGDRVAHTGRFTLLGREAPPRECAVVLEDQVLLVECDPEHLADVDATVAALDLEVWDRSEPGEERAWLSVSTRGAADAEALTASLATHLEPRAEVHAGFSAVSLVSPDARSLATTARALALGVDESATVRLAAQARRFTALVDGSELASVLAERWHALTEEYLDGA